jgi:hypothetical protein
MTTDPTQPDRSAAPPGTINLPLPSATTVGAPPASPTSGFSAGPTDPPVGAGAPMSAAPVDNEAPPPRLVGHRRHRVVIVGIALTVVISLMAISLLYYRWATKLEPTASIVVWAGSDASWDGATVTVRGGGLRGPLSAVLRAEDNLIVRFHVPPGDYAVRVEAPGGRVLARKQTRVQQPLQVGSIWWPFNPPPAATQAGFQ